MLLRKLLTEAALLEDLGGLKGVNPELRKALFKQKETYDDQDKAAQVRPALGKSSQLEAFKDKDQNKAFDRLTGNVRAIIMKVGPNQVLIVARDQESSRYRGRTSKPSYLMQASKRYLELVTQKRHEELFRKVSRGRSGTSLIEISAKDILAGASTDTVGDVKKVLKLIYDVAKENKLPVETLCVTADAERLTKNTARAEARRGAQPTDTGNRVATGSGKYSDYENAAKKYFDALRSDLQTRLEAYKAGKSRAFDDPDELLAAIIKEGYLDKVKLGGYTYKLKSHRINLDVLLGNERDYDKGNGSYIEYQLQGGTPEMKALDARMDKLRDEQATERGKLPHEERDEAQSRHYDERKKLQPPGTFKVVLGMDGGKIVPKAIKSGHGSDYYDFG